MDVPRCGTERLPRSARAVPCEVPAIKRNIDVTCFILFSESKRKSLIRRAGPADEPRLFEVSQLVLRKCGMHQAMRDYRASACGKNAARLIDHLKAEAAAELITCRVQSHGHGNDPPCGV